MRILATGDLHWRGTIPRSRTDRYPDTLKMKLTEVFEIAKERQCELVVIPGDIFDSPHVLYGPYMSLLRLFWTYVPTPTKPSVGLLTIPGNHDLFASSLSSLGRTPYGALMRTLEATTESICELGDGWPRKTVIYHTSNDRATIIVTGTPFSADTDRGTGDYLASETANDVVPEIREIRVHIAHGMLVERSRGTGVRETLIDDVAADARAPDVLICGHDHTGFGVVRRGKTVFVNPGALVRLTPNPAEMERTVQVCLIDIEADKEGRPIIETELIPLKSARPAHEVLSREHLDIAAAAEAEMEEFLAQLAAEGEMSYESPEQIIERLAHAEGIPRRIVDIAIRLVEAERAKTAV